MEQPEGRTRTGLAVGSFVSVLVQPLDVIRTRIQADAANKVATASWRTSKAIYSNYGWRYKPPLFSADHAAGRLLLGSHCAAVGASGKAQALLSGA